MPNTATACVEYSPFEAGDIAMADAIFTAKVARYEIVSPSTPDTLFDYGLITVQVEDVFKGSVPQETQLFWRNSTFAMPETLYVSDPALFAVIKADSSQPPLRGPSATTFPVARPDLFQIMQAPCSDVFILPFDSRSGEAVAELLAGRPVGAIDLMRAEPDNITEVRAIHRAEDPSRSLLLKAFAVLAFMASIAGILLLHRRNKRDTTAA